MWKLDHKEGWVLRNWYFWIVLLERTLESPLDCREIKPVNPKGNQPWIFIRRTDAEAEAPILWPPDAKNWLTGKDPDARIDWGQDEKRATGWDGWMASPTQWAWALANSERQWRTGKNGMLQSMGSQRLRQNLVTQFSHSVMSDSATPWTAARQASLSITISRNPPKPVSFEPVIPSNHLILCPLLPLPSIFPSNKVFSDESTLHIRWPKYWSFSFNISPSNEHSALIFPLGLTAWISLQSKGLSRVFSNTTVQKPQFFGAQFSL